MTGLSMKGFNFSKRSIARFVDESGRKLRGFYPALREHVRAHVLKNRIELAAFDVDPAPRANSTRIPSKNWSDGDAGRRFRRSNNDRGFCLVRPPRPAPIEPSFEARAEQSKRDRLRSLRAKARVQTHGRAG